MRIREWQKKGDSSAEGYAQSMQAANSLQARNIVKPQPTMRTPLHAGEQSSLHGKLVNKLSQVKNSIQQDLNPAHQDPRYHRPR
jgi:hypothetical protein